MLGFEGLNGRKVKFERLQKGVKKLTNSTQKKTLLVVTQLSPTA